MKVRLLNNDFEVYPMNHFKRRARERFGDDGCRDVLVNFYQLCANEDVADYLLNEVPINEVAVLADVDNGITYALKMSLDDITLITVFDSTWTQFRTAKDEKVFYKKKVMEYA